MHAFGIVGWFQENPKETHLQEVKRIFKYLEGTQDFGLWYPKNIEFSLHAYTYTDWEVNIDDYKNTSGGAFYLGPRFISWFSRKQNSIALYTTEEEYIVDASCCTQLLWMIQTLQDTQNTCPQPVPIFYDNTTIISICKNPVMH